MRREVAPLRHIAGKHSPSASARPRTPGQLPDHARMMRAPVVTRATPPQSSWTEMGVGPARAAFRGLRVTSRAWTRCVVWCRPVSSLMGWKR